MRRVLPCRECEAQVDHVLLGRNSVLRPIWECIDCGETRVGPFADAGELAVADGGEEQ